MITDEMGRQFWIANLTSRTGGQKPRYLKTSWCISALPKRIQLFIPAFALFVHIGHHREFAKRTRPIENAKTCSTDC